MGVSTSLTTIKNSPFQNCFCSPFSLQLVFPLFICTGIADKPNKKYYDPRESMRAGELNTIARLDQCFADLKCVNICGLGEVKSADNILGPRRGGLPV